MLERFLFERRQRRLRVAVKVGPKRLVCAEFRDVEAERRDEEETKGRGRREEEETRAAVVGEKEGLVRKLGRTFETASEIVERRESETIEKDFRR